MTFTIPNSADATHEPQAGIYSTDIAILAAALGGDGVLSGCAVTQSANGPGMDVDIAAGAVRINGVAYDISQALDKAISSGNATYPRIDLVEVGTNGTVDVTAGTAALRPVPPAVTADHVALAYVFVDSSESTSIVTADLTDKRAIIGGTPYTVTIVAYASDTATAIADGDIPFVIPAEIDGCDLVDAVAVVHTAGTTGTTDVQLRRRRATTDADMLSTKLTIDTGETDSTTAATAHVINTSNDDVAEADLIFVDCDAISTGTAANGLFVSLTFARP